MNLVSLPRLNELRFATDPVPATKLQRWCRAGELPARKIGGEWYVDLDEFDRGQGATKVEGGSPAEIVRLVIDRLRRRT